MHKAGHFIVKSELICYECTLTTYLGLFQTVFVFYTIHSFVSSSET